MPKFDPKDGDEKQFPPFPRGEYDFSVVNAEEQTSKKGNDMIKIEMSVLMPSGKPRRVFHWLVFTKGMLWNVRHFCEATGLNFGVGELSSEDCLDAKGRALFCSSQDNPSYGEVEKWIRPEKQEPQGAPAGDTSDDIPF